MQELDCIVNICWMLINIDLGQMKGHFALNYINCAVYIKILVTLVNNI